MIVMVDCDGDRFMVMVDGDGYDGLCYMHIPKLNTSHLYNLILKYLVINIVLIFIGK
jgi:phosphomannomutase